MNPRSKFDSTAGESFCTANDLLLERSSSWSVHAVIAPAFQSGIGVDVIVGPNGCGKSTFGLGLANLLERKSGNVIYGGNLPPVFTWQEPSLFPVSVWRNLALVATGSHRDQKIHDIALEFSIERHKKHRPDQLSGGLQQRVALARAFLALEARGCAIFDEPTKETDAHLVDQFVSALDRTLNNVDGSVIIVTHDLQLLMSLRHLSPRLWSFLPLQADELPLRSRIDIQAWHLEGPFLLNDAIIEPPTPHFARLVGFDNVFHLIPVESASDRNSLHRLRPVREGFRRYPFTYISGKDLSVETSPCPMSVQGVRRSRSPSWSKGIGWTASYQICPGHGSDPCTLFVTADEENWLPSEGWIKLKPNVSFNAIELPDIYRQASIEIAKRCYAK